MYQSYCEGCCEPRGSNYQCILKAETGSCIIYHFRLLMNFIALTSLIGLSWSKCNAFIPGYFYKTTHTVGFNTSHRDQTLWVLASDTLFCVMLFFFVTPLHFWLENEIKCYSPRAEVRLRWRLFKICGKCFQLDYACQRIFGIECSPNF